jgi:hypothetical protein
MKWLTLAIPIEPHIFVCSYARVSEPAVHSTHRARALPIASTVQDSNFVTSVTPVPDPIMGVCNVDIGVTAAVDCVAVIFSYVPCQKRIVS